MEKNKINLKKEIEKNLKLSSLLKQRWFKFVDWELKGAELNVICPNIFFKKYIISSYYLNLKKALEDINLDTNEFKIEKINFLVQKKDKEYLNTSFLENILIKKRNMLLKEEWAQLNKSQTFENFLLGDYNFLPYKALQNILEKKVCKERLEFKTLFLASEKSWGKTHLLNAFLNSLLDTSVSIPILKLNADIFKENLWELKSNFFKDNKIEIIIIDDIHKLKNNYLAQEHLINIYDEFSVKNCLFIFSGLNLPNNLSEFSEPLKSRLGSGLTIQIKKPDFFILEKFIKKEALSLNLNLNSEDFLKIIRFYGEDFRLLKGFLKTLAFNNENSGFGLSLSEKLQTLLPDVLNINKKNMNINLILEEVSKAFNLKVADLEAHTKIRQFAWPRRVAMFLIRELSNLTTAEIGAILGGRDHSTVIHGLKKINIELENENNLKLIESIKTNIMKKL